MQSEKISVIIPVYNVERYLDRCVESVLRQNYTNLEILLVDDGSPDNCGMMCDQWAERDSRIRVIHKENGGLSDARNTGIEAATASYISFVDSDDFIAPDMIEKLYQALTSHNAEISICNFYFADEAGVPIPKLSSFFPIQTETISGLEAITKMQTTRAGGCYDLAWNKLYRKELFHDIHFPVGKLCEDGFISHRLLGACTRIACIHEICYYYTQRTGSIMHSNNPRIFLHQAEARIDRMLYCSELKLFRCASNAYWSAAMYLADTYQHGGKELGLGEEMKDALFSLRRHWELKKYCTPKEKLQVFLVCVSPGLYCLIFRNSLRKHAKK